ERRWPSLRATRPWLEELMRRTLDEEPRRPKPLRDLQRIAQFETRAGDASPFATLTERICESYSPAAREETRETMPEPQNFMRVPDPSPKRTLYTDAMEIFHRAADTIGLAPRVRLELEEPDYEHIFYVTAKLKDRLRPLSPEAARSFGDLPVTQVRDPNGRERLADGQILLNGKALLGSDVAIRRGHLRLPDGGVYQLIPGESQRFKAYRVQHNQARGPYKGGIRYH